MDFQQHVAGLVPDGGIQVCGHVVKLLDNTFGCLLGWFCLLAGKSAESSDNGGIDTTSVIPIGANDAMYATFFNVVVFCVDKERILVLLAMDVQISPTSFERIQAWKDHRCGFHIPM